MLRIIAPNSPNAKTGEFLTHLLSLLTEPLPLDIMMAKLNFRDKIVA
jgi:hypothetical protein